MKSPIAVVPFPAEPNAVLRLEGAEVSKPMLLREEVQRRIHQLDGLPTAPATLQRIWEALRNPDAGSRELAQTIALDSALTARVLRLANSSYYALNRAVSDVREATVVLGFETVKSLAIGSSVVDAFRGRVGEFDITEFWRHGVETAVAAEVLSRSTGFDRPEVAFTGGILHDVGRLALASVAHASGMPLPGIGGSGEGDTLCDVGHQTAGLWLGRRWKFSPELLSVIAFHHTPECAGDDRRLVSFITLGESLLRSGRTVSGSDPEPWDEACADYLGLGEEELIAVRDSLPDRVGAAAPMMGFCS